MPQEAVITTLSRLSARSLGVFRAEGATALGVTTNQLARLSRQGVIERMHPSTYRMTAVTPSSAQRLHAALLWAGDCAAVAGRSAGELYRLEGVRAPQPEIVVPHHRRGRMTGMTVYHGDPAALMVRRVAGFRATGVEATLLCLAHLFDGEAFEVACEDARRRRLTSVPALRAVPRPLRAPRATGRRTDAPDAVRARSQASGAIDPGSQDPAAARRPRHHRLRAGVPTRVERPHLPLRLRVHRRARDPRGQRPSLARRRGRLRTRPGEVECARRRGFRIVFATWDTITRRPQEFVDELLRAPRPPGRSERRATPLSYAGATGNARLSELSAALAPFPASSRLRRPECATCVVGRSRPGGRDRRRGRGRASLLRPRRRPRRRRRDRAEPATTGAPASEVTGARGPRGNGTPVTFAFGGDVQFPDQLDTDPGDVSSGIPLRRPAERRSRPRPRPDRTGAVGRRPRHGQPRDRDHVARRARRREELPLPLARDVVHRIARRGRRRGQHGEQPRARLRHRRHAGHVRRHRVVPVPRRRSSDTTPTRRTGRTAP